MIIKLMPTTRESITKSGNSGITLAVKVTESLISSPLPGKIGSSSMLEPTSQPGIMLMQLLVNKKRINEERDRWLLLPAF
jgi:hypothetical protein